MANGECDLFDFTYKDSEWNFPYGTLCAEFKLHLERWVSGQIVLNCVEGEDGQVINGWVDAAMRDWVQGHQHKLGTVWAEYLSENEDGGAGDRVDYEMSRAR